MDAHAHASRQASVREIWRHRVDHMPLTAEFLDGLHVSGRADATHRELRLPPIVGSAGRNFILARSIGPLPALRRVQIEWKLVVGRFGWAKSAYRREWSRHCQTARF
jgi:hypothetical protein